MKPMKRFIKIKSVSQGSFYIQSPDEPIMSIVDLLDGAEPGEENGHVVSIVEMTQEQYEALPEFIGF